MIKRAVLKIYGEVQGVGFRYRVAEQVRDLNLTGWVRNAPGGTVEILAESEEKNLKKLIDYCQEGPKFAKVDRVEVKWEEATGEYNDFLIKYN